MADPRSPNCRGVKVDTHNRIVGVELAYQPVPSAQYELVQAELVDEQAAVGTTTAKCTVLDKNGFQTGEKVWLAWAWPSIADGHGLPGNAENTHMITNGYTPPELGPLALYVGDAEARPISDIIGGLGLPWNRHIGFKLTWRERGAVVTEPVDPGEPVDPVAGSPVLERIAVALERIAQHMGA